MKMIFEVESEDLVGIQKAQAILERLERLLRLTPAGVGVTNLPVEPRIAEFVWTHVGHSMKLLISKIWEYQGFDYTQKKLAENLGRPHQSVKASMNGGLGMVYERAKTAIPDAPKHLFVWTENKHGIMEFGMSDAMREAFRPFVEPFIELQTRVPKAS